jgi:AraC-like DNA-binding protein
MVKLLKQHPRLSHIPVIMLTAKSDNITENESIKLGIDVFMAKPFEPKALIGRIKLLLKSRNDIKERIRIQAITESESKPITAETANEKLLAKIAKTIEENISDPDLNVNSLCEKLGLDQKHLYRLIKKYMNTAPLDYIRRVRLQKAAVLLSQRRFTVSEIAYMVGFKTPSYFAKCFQAQFGVKPSQYQSDDEI